MDDRTAGATRRTRPGLVIEGSAVPARAPARTRSGPFGPTDLAARSEGRPAQSLLDDALRLARECRFLQGKLRSLPFS